MAHRLLKRRPPNGLLCFAGAAAILAVVLGTPHEVRAQAGDFVTKYTAAELAKWAGKKAGEAYQEYKKMREAQKQQKQAEERLKSQKEFEAEWYKKNQKAVKDKERELQKEAKQLQKQQKQQPKK